MNIKRVGHSIIHHEGSLYCIGGKTNYNTNTKLCEKYNILLDSW